MRYRLPILLLFFASASVASTQQASPLPVPVHFPAIPMPTPSVMKGDLLPSLPSAANSEYVWFPPIFRNRDARVYPFVPYRFAPQPGSNDTIEWRGIGQIFAPSFNHGFYSGSIYNDTSNIYYDTTGGGPGDQDYIDQFLDAASFTIDSLQIFVFENALAGRGNYGGKVLVMKTTTDFSSAAYRNDGYARLRQDLPVVWEQVLTPDVLDAASRGPDTTIATRIRIPASANIRFAEGESAVVLYVNDEAPAPGPDNVPPNADVQQVTTQLEWRDGSFYDTTLANPLDDYKSLGVVLFRDRNGNETILSGFRNLTYQGVRGIFDLLMVFWGTVEGKAGVNYHIGTAVSATTLGRPTPNPAIERTRIPFTLMTRTQTKLDLYDATGRLIRALADEDFPAGAWSVDLQTSDLPAGLYFVRMIAGDRVMATQMIVGSRQ